MNYLNNADLAKALIDYNNKKNHKTERTLYKHVRLMIDRIIKERKFNGYVNLHDEMIANALYFFAINLERGNIKVREIKECNNVYIRRESDLVKLNVNVDDENNDILGSEVCIVGFTNDKKIIVKKIEKTIKKNNFMFEFVCYKKKYYIDNVYIAFNNIFSYITSIIEDSYWKIINEEIHQSNKNQFFYNNKNDMKMFINSTIKNDNSYVYESNYDESSKYDFTSDTNKEKIEKMRLESIEHEKGLIAKKSRKKNMIESNHSIMNKRKRKYNIEHNYEDRDVYFKKVVRKKKKKEKYTYVLNKKNLFNRNKDEK